MNIRKTLPVLLLVALGISVFGSAWAQHAPVLVTKSARWATWGPNGAVAFADTALLDGAVVDTTEGIYIGDMAFAGSVAGGAAATAPVGMLKVSVIGLGVADNVDSVYYRIEGSPDGTHWTSVLAAEALNNQIGAIAGIDQGAGTAGTTVNNCVSFFVRTDTDQVQDGASGTAALFNHAWVLSPYIRIFFRTLASDIWKAGKLFVSYPGYRESH